MLRLLILCIPAIIIMLGFGMPFFISGSKGYILAAISIVFGGWIFWFIEEKTISHLKNPSILNDILNTNETDD